MELERSDFADAHSQTFSNSVAQFQFVCMHVFVCGGMFSCCRRFKWCTLQLDRFASAVKTEEKRESLILHFVLANLMFSLLVVFIFDVQSL